MEENYEWAGINYTRAIERRDDFFYYYLQRGIANKELGETAAAKADLEASIELMPTANAYFVLGTIAEEEGNVDAAIDYYKPVAETKGEVGEAARKRLARLDLPNNPSAYIPFNCVADTQQNLVVQVRNDAPETIRDVEVVVTYTGSDGRARQLPLEIRGPLDPGEVGAVNTGLAPYTGGNCPVAIVGAEFAE